MEEQPLNEKEPSTIHPSEGKYYQSHSLIQFINLYIFTTLPVILPYSEYFQKTAKNQAIVP